VTSDHEPLRKRVEAVLDMALTTVTSLDEAFTAGAAAAAEEPHANIDKAKLTSAHLSGEEGTQGGSSAIPSESVPGNEDSVKQASTLPPQAPGAHSADEDAKMGEAETVKTEKEGVESTDGAGQAQESKGSVPGGDAE